MDIEKILIAILLTPAVMLVIPFLLAMWPAFLVVFSLQLALENIDTLGKVFSIGMCFYSIYFIFEVIQSYISNKYKGDK